MLKHRWLLAIPLALAVTIGPAAAASIRDDASLFTPDAVRAAETKLDQIERETGVTTTIETLDSLDGRSLIDLTAEHAKRAGHQGLYILIPKKEHKVEVLATPFYHRAIPAPKRLEVRDAFVKFFRDKDFDAGLKNAVETIGPVAVAAHSEIGKPSRAATPPVGPIRGRPVVRQGGNSFGLSSLLGIGLLVVAVLVGIRLIGSLFGGGRGAYGPGAGQPGMGPGPGYGGGPGYGPGYGAPRGGGIFSSMLGGIGGALAGNWLYDQFSGRHHGGNYADTTAPPGVDPGAPADGGGDWAAGGSEGGDWGGGNDGGGGGDWGGGGGGDGGDWGGGGGDGGSW